MYIINLPPRNASSLSSFVISDSLFNSFLQRHWLNQTESPKIAIRTPIRR